MVKKNSVTMMLMLTKITPPLFFEHYEKKIDVDWFITSIIVDFSKFFFQ